MTDEARFKIQAERLRAIQERDHKFVLGRERRYDRSWMKRGGVGAYVTALGRKWDRIESLVEAEGPMQYDIFKHIQAEYSLGIDHGDKGVMDDIRDLRNYLLLVEEEMMHKNVIPDVLPKKSKGMPSGTPQQLSSEDRMEDKLSRRDQIHHPFGFDPKEDNTPKYTAPAVHFGPDDRLDPKANVDAYKDTPKSAEGRGGGESGFVMVKAHEAGSLEHMVYVGTQRVCDDLKQLMVTAETIRDEVRKLRK